jgi:hypothetical protein
LGARREVWQSVANFHAADAGWNTAAMYTLKGSKLRGAGRISVYSETMADRSIDEIGGTLVHEQMHLKQDEVRTRYNEAVAAGRSDDPVVAATMPHWASCAMPIKNWLEPLKGLQS